MRNTLFTAVALFGAALVAPGLAQAMTPQQYLAEALTAVQQHQPQQALGAVNSAENAFLLGTAVEEIDGTRDTPNEPPIVRQMGLARDAIAQGYWDQAARYITAAMSHAEALVGGSGSVGGLPQE